MFQKCIIKRIQLRHRTSKMNIHAQKEEAKNYQNKRKQLIKTITTKAQVY